MNATGVVYVNFDPEKTVGKTTAIVEMLEEKSTLSLRAALQARFTGTLISGSETAGMQAMREFRKCSPSLSRLKNPGYRKRISISILSPSTGTATGHGNNYQSVCQRKMTNTCISLHKPPDSLLCNNR